jgi:hypothetical protein
VAGGQQIVVYQDDVVQPVDLRDAGAVDAAESDGPTGGGFALGRILAAIGVLVFVSAGASVLVVVGLKRRRTTQRRAALDPRLRTVGAWHDVVDRLVEAGTNSAATSTVEELVGLRETNALAGLYRPVSRALYSGAEVTADDAAQAWKARDRFVRALRRDSTRWQRMRCALDPRPLVRDRTSSAVTS